MLREHFGELNSATLLRHEALPLPRQGLHMCRVAGRFQMDYLVAGPYVRADWCRAREAEGWDLVGVPDHLTGRGLPWTHLFVTAAEVEAGLGCGLAAR